MRVSVFGLGYVGCVSAGCLAANGHIVIGVDIDNLKVDLINSGKPTIIEKDLNSLIYGGYIEGRITATSDYMYAIQSTDISIICVGTPSSETGSLNLSYVYGVVEQIGEAVKNKQGFHTVVIRSTVLPGTTEKIELLIEKISGKKNIIDFGVIANPEFLREGSAVHDYYNHPVTLIGSHSPKAISVLKEVYKDIESTIIEMDVKECEIMKYVCNSFHALKIVFANEVGNVCKKLGIDGYRVMEVFCKDTKLNISPYYLKPGFSYGGSCLPKDLKGLCTLATDNHYEAPLINSISRSNELQKEIVLKMIQQKGKKNIGILGLSFKAGTDDLRDSPIVDIVERLIGKGFNVKIYDKNVHLSNLIGTNKKYIHSKISHLESLITDNLDDVVESSELVVISYKDAELETYFINGYYNKIVIDLIRMGNEIENGVDYCGICW